MLSGREATEMFLQCYQLIVWKQCFFLVNGKGFPKELETVVRDLWGLRLAILHRNQGDAGLERFGSMGFSSTSGGETTDSDGKSLISSRSRRAEIRREDMPKLIETLALCYLGTLLLRLPTSMGEMLNWAARDEMVYARAVSYNYLQKNFSLSGSVVIRMNVNYFRRLGKCRKRCGHDYLDLSIHLWKFGNL